MRLVMFVRISRCPEYQSSYLPLEENHAQTNCANLTTETVFNLTIANLGVGDIVMYMCTGMCLMCKGM